MTREERMQRIAGLLVQACRRYWARVKAGELPAPPESESARPADSLAAELTDEERIINYLSRGSASPREIRAMLGFSRSTFNRRIAGLLAAGRVILKGRTRQAHYHLGKGGSPEVSRR